MRALLSVSFGTSYEETRVKTIDAIEAKLREEFCDFEFYQAWTSPRIIERVKSERGEHHDTLDEAFERMSADGVNDLVVSTMCLMQGGEMAKIERAAQTWASVKGRSMCVSSPLLASSTDRKEMARVICDEFADVAPHDVLLLMGHGSSQAPNGVYSQIQDEFHSLGRTRFFVATVEGAPTFEDVYPRVELAKPTCVHLAPLMIVAGDHAKRDLAGADERSWASMLATRGFNTNVVMRGLGEYSGIQELVCRHVRDALVLREVSLRG